MKLKIVAGLIAVSSIAYAAGPGKGKSAGEEIKGYGTEAPAFDKNGQVMSYEQKRLEKEKENSFLDPQVQERQAKRNYINAKAISTISQWNLRSPVESMVINRIGAEDERFIKDVAKILKNWKVELDCPDNPRTELDCPKGETRADMLELMQAQIVIAYRRKYSQDTPFTMALREPKNNQTARDVLALLERTPAKTLAGSLAGSADPMLKGMAKLAEKFVTLETDGRHPSNLTIDNLFQATKDTQNLELGAKPGDLTPEQKTISFLEKLKECLKSLGPN